MAKASFTQKVALRQFLAGAQPALVEMDENPEKVTTSTRTVSIDLVGKPTSFEVKTYNFDNDTHSVSTEFGDLTSDFIVKPGKKWNDELKPLEGVMLFTDFVATGERVPALLVPDSMVELAEKLLQEAGLKKNNNAGPYNENHEFMVFESGRGNFTQLVIPWDDFRALAKTLSAGLSP